MIRFTCIGNAAAFTSVHVQSWQEAYKGLIPENYLVNLSVEHRKEPYKRSLESDQVIFKV